MSFKSQLWHTTHCYMTPLAHFVWLNLLYNILPSSLQDISKTWLAKYREDLLSVVPNWCLHPESHWMEAAVFTSNQEVDQTLVSATWMRPSLALGGVIHRLQSTWFSFSFHVCFKTVVKHDILLKVVLICIESSVLRQHYSTFSSSIQSSPLPLKNMCWGLTRVGFQMNLLKIKKFLSLHASLTPELQDSENKY